MTIEVSTLTDLSNINLTSWNTFLYGPPRCGKTYTAASWPDPFWCDAEQGHLTLARIQKDRGIRIPVLHVDTFDVIKKLLLGYPKSLTPHLQGAFEGYVPKTLVLDTVTAIEDLSMSERVEFGRPDISDFGDLYYEMQPLFRLAAKLPIHVVFLAHDYEGGIDMRTPGKKAKPPAAPGPALTGKLRKLGPAVCDFFIVQERQRVGNRDIFTSYMSTSPAGYPAGIRALDEGYLDYKIENLSFNHLQGALLQLKVDLGAYRPPAG